MATHSAPGPLTTEAIQKAIEKKAEQRRSLKLPWILFLVIGVPLGVIAALGPLTAAHIYIDPLRRFWQPWPPDLAKPLLGIAGFSATLAYLAYRRGKARGFHSGTVAATATLRNVVEGRTPVPGQNPIPPAPTSSETFRDSLDSPMESPEEPRADPPPPLEPIAP